jgi:L-lactate dehydrogenase (cytochrome)
MRFSQAQTIAELKEIARRRVPRMFFDYADSGSWSESTYRANSEDFEKILFRQRIAVDMTDRSLKSTMVGQPVAMPIALAPTGLTGMQIADGEIKAARAAEAFGVPFTLSTMSVCSIEDVAENVTKPFWFQLYVMRDREFIARLIARARAAECSALVLTMDLQILGNRHKDARNELSTPPRPSLKHLWQVGTRPSWALGMLGTRRYTFRNIAGHVENTGDLRNLAAWTAKQFDPRLNWADLAWVKERFGGKVIVKGILDAEDAEMAVAHGADAIIVSNHGGRQLDGAPSSIRVLPEIVAAVGSRTEIYIDGGISRGQNLLRAMALGARGAFIGRAFLWGLGAGGEAGVTRALSILRNETDITMALLGERDITRVGAHNIYRNGLRDA